MKCTATNKSGQPCGVPALKGEERCLFHSSSETALGYRRRAHEPGGFVSRKELLRIVSADFRYYATKTDDASRKERLKIFPLLHELINEQQQLGKLKRLAKEKGLI